MKIIVNGEDKEVKEGIKIGELLDELKIRDKIMAVAVDMNVIKKENWDKTILHNGARVEFLHFVGGG